MKTNFLNNLDGGWEDVIETTYRETAEILLEYPLMDVFYYNVDNETKVIDAIIIKNSPHVEIKVLKSPHNFIGETYSVYLKNVPISNVTYRLRGIKYNKDDELTYSPLLPLEGDDSNKKISYLISITKLKKPGPYNQKNLYFLSMSNDPDFDEKEVLDRSKNGYKPARFNSVSQKWNEKPKFGITLLEEFENIGLDVL